MVFDEIPQLIDAAGQMYSIVWDEQDAEFIRGFEGSEQKNHRHG